MQTLLGEINIFGVLQKKLISLL